MPDRLYEMSLIILYPLTFVLIAIVAQLGIVIGWRLRNIASSAEISTFTGAALGMLALLLGFSFSLALTRFDARRNWVLEEANAISSTVNFALMLPDQNKRQILNLLREYVGVRRDLGIPYDPVKMDHDVAKSVAIQTTLWEYATEISDDGPRSLAVHRFITSLNEMNNVHERRVTELRNHVPGAVMCVLLGVTMLTMGFAGYHAGVTGARRHAALFMMSIMVAVVILLIFDLDRPTRGFVKVPIQALVDAANGIPPPTR